MTKIDLDNYELKRINHGMLKGMHYAYNKVTHKPVSDRLNPSIITALREHHSRQNKEFYQESKISRRHYTRLGKTVFNSFMRKISSQYPSKYHVIIMVSCWLIANSKFCAKAKPNEKGEYPKLFKVFMSIRQLSKSIHISHTSVELAYKVLRKHYLVYVARGCVVLSPALNFYGSNQQYLRAMDYFKHLLEHKVSIYD